MSLSRSGPIRPRNPERRDREWRRAYGSEARVRWVQRQPCAVCGERGCENAHVRSGGMGRKADARWIVPLCPLHHRQLHTSGQQTCAEAWGLDLEDEARKTDERWQQRKEAA